MRTKAIVSAAALVMLGTFLLAAPPAEAGCTAIASCGSGTVSCTGYSTCESQDDSCPTSDGYVVCDGVRKSCGGCPCPDEGQLCMTDADCRDSGYPICDTCFCGLKAPVDEGSTEKPNGYCQCYLW